MTQLTCQARTLHEEKRLEVLVDRDLRGCFDVPELEKAVELALQCTQSNPNLRPKMSDVFKVLEGLGQVDNMEDSQDGNNNLGEDRECSFSRNYSDIHRTLTHSEDLSGRGIFLGRFRCQPIAKPVSCSSQTRHGSYPSAQTQRVTGD